MSPSAEKHRRLYPNARPSKLRQLEIKDATTAQLQREIRAKAEADAKVNDFRESEDWRGPNALLLIAGKLKVLAARLVN